MLAHGNTLYINGHKSAKKEGQKMKFLATKGDKYAEIKKS
jgi:hypothetical protein